MKLSVILLLALGLFCTGCATTAQTQQTVQLTDVALNSGYNDAVIILDARWQNGAYTPDQWNKNIVPAMQKAAIAIAAAEKAGQDATASTQPSMATYLQVANDALDAVVQILLIQPTSGPAAGSPPPTALPVLP